MRQSGQSILDSTFCSRFILSVRMVAHVTCVLRLEASHSITCVTACYLHRQTGGRDPVDSTVFLYSPPPSPTPPPPPLLDCEHPTRRVPGDWAVRVDHDFMWSFVFLHWFFQLAIHNSPGSLADFILNKINSWLALWWPTPRGTVHWQWHLTARTQQPIRKITYVDVSWTPLF